jgi:hypothetical protein
MECATFCYGGYLGPTHTAHSLKDLDRFQVAYVNQRHITEQKLLDAHVKVINRDTPYGQNNRAATHA